MPKQPQAIAEMPPAVRLALRRLGEHLTLARKRRKEPRKAWAQRIGVSEPTLMRMESGDPSVAFGIYATVLWMIGRADAIPQLADPQLDLGALESEIRVAKARSVRSAPSIEARLRSDKGKDTGRGKAPSLASPAASDPSAPNSADEEAS